MGRPPELTRRSQPPTGRRGLGAWVLVFTAGVAWELFQFVQHPRRAHPTLSSMANHVIASHPVRAGVLLVWLAVGWLLIRW